MHSKHILLVSDDEHTARPTEPSPSSWDFGDRSRHGSCGPARPDTDHQERRIDGLGRIRTVLQRSLGISSSA